MKTILITGASSGIGKACAERFGFLDGYRLILCARREDRLLELKTKIKNPAHVLCFDVCSKNSVSDAIASLPIELSNIDILVNNAGAAFGMELAHEAKIKDWEEMIDLNIKGLLNVTRAILPKMVKSDNGHIINMGSVAGFYAYTGGNVYGATKAFVYQFSNNLRADLLGKNIRVSVIAPGLVETDFFKVRFKGDEERVKKHFQGLNALKPNDIAEAIFWCTTQPLHVNVNLIEVMPICQALTNISVNRK